ncbi:MAG: hypothetical protein NTW19_24005 [Planctomycetota bacterium]|nr:hypothetical protein [Planctomycetota bacterium]
MRISPNALAGLRRVYRTFWAAFVPLTVATAFLVPLAMLIYGIFFIATNVRNGVWVRYFLGLLDAPLSSLDLLLLYAVTFYVLAYMALALGILLAAILHTMLVVEPAVPLDEAQAGEPVLAVRARIKHPGQWLGSAGRLHLTRKFFVFVPHRWRLTAGSPSAAEELMLPLTEISQTAAGRTWLLLPLRLRLVRHSGDEEHLRVWRPRRFTRWLADVAAGKTPPAALPGHHRRRRLALSAVIAALLFAFVAWHVTLRVIAAREYARVRAEGLPVTLTELDAFYSTPTGENAATLYHKAATAYVGNNTLEPLIPEFGSDPKVVVPALGEALQPAARKATEDFLAPNQPALDQIRQARDISECRYPVNLTLGIGATMPYLGEVHRMRYPLKLAARLAAERGDGEAATQSILDILGIARSFRREPILITQLAKLAEEFAAADALETCLALTRFSDDQLTRLAEPFRVLPDFDGIDRAWASERCFYLSVLDDSKSLLTGSTMSAMMGSGAPPPPRMALYLATGLRDLDRLKVLRWSREAVAWGHEAVHHADSPGNSPPNGVSPVFLVSSQIPDFHAVEKNTRTARVRAVIVLAAIAAKRFQLAHGSLPDRLDLLVPEFLPAAPADLFDGQPLRYKRTPRGALVYSVGPDLKDNGGVKGNTPGSSNVPESDIVFELFEKP